MERLLKIFVVSASLLTVSLSLSAKADSTVVANAEPAAAVLAKADTAAVPSAVPAADSAAVQSQSEAKEEDKGFDALKYTLQKRYINRGLPFKSSGFFDNTFLSFHGGSEQLVPFGNSSLSWGLAAKLSFGKWIDRYNAVRFSLACEQHLKNINRQRIWNVGFDVSHMFNLSSYFGGYKPSRFFEISTVEGFKYRYSMLNGSGIHAGGLHVGLNLRMNVAKNLDFFVEPLVTAYSDGTDHSGGWNWRIYDIGYGGTMGLSVRFHSDKEYRCGPADAGNSFISFSAGPQFQNSDLVYDIDGFARSLGAQYNISYGRWFSRVFALRITGFYADCKWKEFVDGTRKSTLYYGARVEGMLDLVRLFAKDKTKDPKFSLPILFGPEVGGMTKQDLTRNINRLYIGLAGGCQFKYRVADYIAVFAEPHFSIVPYNVINESSDPLKNIGVNYYDATFNLNFGVELDFGRLKDRQNKDKID